MVEAWHTHGDDYVREAATIGFLETLGNHLHGTGIEMDGVRSMLGVESRKWWDRLTGFWEGDTSALADGGGGNS